MKLRVLTALILFCAVLSGCMKIEQDTENLMRPPKLSVEQQQIFSALNAAVGTAIDLKYPSEGDHRSAFVMVNIDADSEDEAIVFYALTAKKNELRVNILDRQNGEWYSLYDAGSEYSDVDSISFANILSVESKNIVISYSQVSRNKKTITVYSFKNRMLVDEFHDEFTSSLIKDFDEDGRDEILLLYNLRPDADSEAKLVDTTYRNGKLGVVATLTPLYESVVEYVNLSVEKNAVSNTIKGSEGSSTSSAVPAQAASDGITYNVFVDGKTNTGSYVTEIIGVGHNRLKNQLLKAKDDYTKATVRSVQMMTKDINSDGLLEVPMGVRIPGSEYTNEVSIFSLIRWDSFIDKALCPTIYTLENEAFRFSLQYPGAWNEKNISVQQKDNEWIFYEFLKSSNTDTGSVSEQGTIGAELLSIKVLNKDGYIKKNEMERYSFISTNNEYSYYAYIPSFEGQEKNALAITLEEFKTLFHC